MPRLLQTLHVVRELLRLSPSPPLPRSQTDRSASFTPTPTRTRSCGRNWRSHLSLLRRQGLISAWHDRMIGAGEEWKGSIDKNLEEAQSSSCWSVRRSWPRITARTLRRSGRSSGTTGRGEGDPGHAATVDWQGAPFARLQGLPIDLRPVTTWPNRDEAFTEHCPGYPRSDRGHA